MNVPFDQLSVSDDQSQHLLNGAPLYQARFLNVLNFHPPGVAAVLDQVGAYHIDLSGKAIYPERYLRTFGFYHDRAAVVDDKQNWFHILLSGKRLYNENYSWCGNFQNGACVVKDKNNSYFHLDLDGKPLYQSRYIYVGDFKDSIAVVRRDDGLATHINRKGEYLHRKWFRDLDIFHKGFARAKDDYGWCHIDRKGVALYPERYQMIEPFYNGSSVVEDRYGAVVIIDEFGRIAHHIKKPDFTPLQSLSADLVGYWKTQTIKAAVELKVFDFLPNSADELAARVGLSQEALNRLLRALLELNLIYQDQNKIRLTEKGEILRSDHEMSLASAVIHWADKPYLAWMSLVDSLKNNSASYQKQYGQPIFDWLDDNSEDLSLYHRALASYAKHDYPLIADKVDLSKSSVVIDAAGGSGVLLSCLLQKYHHLQGILLEREEVIKSLKTSGLNDKFLARAFDLFKTWPCSADTIFLSRIIHDWSDQDSIAILQRAKEALLPGGAIYLIERLLMKSSGDGGMLDLNMLVLTGGKERSQVEFVLLANSAGLYFVEAMPLANGNYLLKLIAGVI